MKNHIGLNFQIRGAERYTLGDGRGKGMEFLYVRNGLGLCAWISMDRAGDISRLEFEGANMGFMSPCGYVAPTYYEKEGTGFLKSFTAGFFTTCGLTAVGSPSEDDGEVTPLHGTISHIPALLRSIEEDEDSLKIKLWVSDAVILGRKQLHERVYTFSYREKTSTVSDTVKNEGDIESPYMIMYHCNMGYPLLSEESILKIPYNSITARTDNALEHIDSALKMEPPQPNFLERCYYYDLKETDSKAQVGIFNPELGKGLVMSFSKAQLPEFIEWKMMGRRDYVLGLEPANCTPDGRAVMREQGKLKFLKPDEEGVTELTFSFLNNEADFEGKF